MKHTEATTVKDGTQAGIERKIKPPPSDYVVEASLELIDLCDCERTLFLCKLGGGVVYIIREVTADGRQLWGAVRGFGVDGGEVEIGTLARSPDKCAKRLVQKMVNDGGSFARLD